MQSTAQQIHPDQTSIPELKIVEKPLYFVGTQVRALDKGDWEAFKEDFSKHYVIDSRWCGEKFTSWSLEKYDGYKLVAKRGGYVDAETGIFHHGSRA
jgi:hypothetical protein